MRVVVVEDQVLFRECLVRILEEKLDCEVVGIAEDGECALGEVRRLRPDLLILDILIPRLSGIHVASTLQSEFPGLRILALSSELDIKTVYQLHRLQLAGFIDKNDATVETLGEAIGCMRRRERYFAPSFLKVIGELRADPTAFQKILTCREQEILTLIGAGKSDTEIAAQLGLGDSSVQTHRRNLFRKLDVHSTPELMRYAQDSGFWKAAFDRLGLADRYHLHE